MLSSITGWGKSEITGSTGLDLAQVNTLDIKMNMYGLSMSTILSMSECISGGKHSDRYCVKQCIKQSNSINAHHFNCHHDALGGAQRPGPLTTRRKLEKYGHGPRIFCKRPFWPYGGLVTLTLTLSHMHMYTPPLITWRSFAEIQTRNSGRKPYDKSPLTNIQTHRLTMWISFTFSAN